jgi:hypothetical protein
MNTFTAPHFRNAALGVAAVKLWFVAAQPVVAIGPAVFDDRLFLELARHILQGDWLGPYSEFTLSKGPMYSIWIAATFLLGVPLPLANHLLYLTACWLLVRALRPHLGSNLIAFGVLALLWFNPMSYQAPVLGRVLRQNLYTPAALLLFAGLIALETRRSATTRVRIAWGLLIGVSFATLWLTREESVWVFPSMLLLTGAAAWNSWRAGERARPLFAPVIGAVASAAVLLGVICTLNYRHYGWFGTVEFRAPQFLAAYGALQRVQSNKQIPFVPVTREAREKCYRVSPTFAELRPFLEGVVGEWATNASWMTGRPPSEREMAGGWFMWALRGAVAAAGYHRDAATALAFYDRMAAEINQACDEKELRARPRRDSMAPNWTWQDGRRILTALPDYLDYFVTFRGFSARGQSSEGTAEQLMLFRDLTRWPCTAPLIASEVALPLQQRYDNGRISVLDGFGRFSRWVCAVVVIGGAAIFLGLIARAAVVRRGSYVLVVITATLGAVLAVVLINALVHVLSFPNQSPGAFAQVYPLAILYGALAWLEAGRIFLKR